MVIATRASRIDNFTDKRLMFRDSLDNEQEGFLTSGNLDLIRYTSLGTVDLDKARYQILELYSDMDVYYPGITGSSTAFSQFFIRKPSSSNPDEIIADLFFSFGINLTSEEPMNIEKDIAVLLPPKREYVTMIRVQKKGKARPMISLDADDIIDLD